MHPSNKIVQTLFVLLFIGFFACTNENTNLETVQAGLSLTEKVAQLPKLLDRTSKIQLGKEWENVQNLYGKCRQQILDDSKAEEATLQLAQLFTIEARVTGEHGHYYPAALELLNDLLKKENSGKGLKFSALLTKAGVQLSQHDFEGTLKTVKIAVSLNPYDAQIYGVLVDAYVGLGSYSTAVKVADRMIAIRPDLPSYSRVSHLREIYGLPVEAIEAMELAVEAGYPGYEETAWARLQLGQLYETYGTLEQAEAQYLRILQERSDYPFAIAALAGVAHKRGNFEKAEQLLKQAGAIIPEVSYFEQLAHVYQATGREAEKEALVKNIFEMLKDDVNSGHNMNLEYAHIYMNLKNDLDKALKYTLSEYEKRPNNIDVNRLLAEIYIQKNDFETARKYFKRASLTNSKHPELIGLKAVLVKI